MKALQIFFYVISLPVRIVIACIAAVLMFFVCMIFPGDVEQIVKEFGAAFVAIFSLKPCLSYL